MSARHGTSDGPSEGPARRRHSLKHRPGPGTPLPASMRKAAEASTRTDLGQVRIHSDRSAEAFTGMLGSRAAQWQNHIFVRPDAYAPATEAGRALLGHELMHAAQFAHHGAGPAPLSARASPSEVEADRLGPAVLDGTADTAVPALPTGARLNLNGGGPGENLPADLPPEICEPETFLNPYLHPSPLLTPEEEEASGDSGNPYLDGPLYPETVEVTTLTNRQLIEEAISTRRELAQFTQTDETSMAYEDLDRRLDEERTRRIDMGYVFLAAAQTSVPENIVQLRPNHPAPDVTAVMIFDPEAALGMPTVLINGILLVPDQLDAYLKSAQQMPIDGAQAQLAMQILETGNLHSLIQNGGGEGKDQAGGARVIGTRTALHSPINQLLSYDAAGGNMLLPRHLSDLSNTVGRTGEVFTQFDRSMGYGTQTRDLNLADWYDINGRLQRGNAPVFDFQRMLDPIRWSARPENLISVAGTQQRTRRGRTDFLMGKVADMVDAHNRGPLPPPDAALQHLRETSRRPGLQTTDADFADVRTTYLPDTFYAVPDGQVETIRQALANPDAVPFGGARQRAITRPGFQALYDSTLARQAITVETSDGRTIDIRSLADLAVNAPRHDTLPRSMRGGRDLEPIANRLTEAQYTSVLTELGMRTAGTIVNAETAAQMRGSMDSLRGAGNGGPDPTRILEVRLGDPGANINRLQRAVAHTGPGTPAGVREVQPAGGDRFLSAVRMHMTGGQPITRHDNDFGDLRQQMIEGAEMRVPRGEAQPLIDRIMNSNSAEAVAIRDAIAAEIPDMTVEEFLNSRVQEFDLTGRQLRGQGNYRADIATWSERSGASLDAHLYAGAMEAYQNPYLMDGQINFDAVRTRAGRSVGMNAGMAGFGQVAGNYYNHIRFGDQLQDFSGTQMFIDTSLGFAQDEFQYGASRLASQHVPIENARVRGFVGGHVIGGGASAAFASIGEIIAIARMERELLEGEAETRVVRAAGLGLVSYGAGAAAQAGTLYIIGSFTAGGSAVGPVGTAVGFLVGAGVATVVYLELDRQIGGSGRDYDAEYAEHERQRRLERLAELEEQLRQPLATFNDQMAPLPVAPSPDLTAQEQLAIARFFQAQALHSPEDEFVGPPTSAMVCLPDPEALVCMP